MKAGFKEWIDFGRNILLFREEAYQTHAARSDVMQRGLLILVVVTLLAGLLPFLVGLVGDWISPAQPPDWITSNQAPSPEDLFGPVAQFLPSDLGDTIKEYFDPNIMEWVQVGIKISNLPTLMPKPIGTLFERLGEYVSLPLSRLSRWMLYTLAVLLIAHLMGGKASVMRMLGATALYSIPHLLDMVSFVPCLGRLLGLAATLWGIGIYVKSVAVSNEFTIGRAVLVSLLPAVIAILVGIVVMTFGALLIAIASG